MKEVRYIKISDLCRKICSGGTPKSSEPSYYNGSIPWLNTKEVNFNRIYSTEKNITVEGLKNSSAKWIEANSIIVAMYGATAGKTAISTIPLTTNQACCNLMIDEHIADYRYVYYALKSNYEKLASLANGGAQQNLNAQQIKDFEIPYLSLSEQKNIANVLSSFDDKIELNRRINDNLEQQAQALFKSWFVDFEPFKNGKFIDSELGKIPEGWKVGSIGDYCKIRSGFAFKSSWWTDKGVKIVKIKNISSSGNLDMNDCSYVSKENIRKAKEFSLKSGDLLIAMTGATIGKFCIVPVLQEEMYVNQRVGKFFLGENPISKVPFIYGLLKGENIITQIINKGQGSAQPNISANDIESIPIILPTKEIISEYNKLVSPYFSLLIENLKECDYIENLRDTLLPKLMSGEIKI